MDYSKIMEIINKNIHNKCYLVTFKHTFDNTGLMYYQKVSENIDIRGNYLIGLGIYYLKIENVLNVTYLGKILVEKIKREHKGEQWEKGEFVISEHLFNNIKEDEIFDINISLSNINSHGYSNYIKSLKGN